ncbi:MAG: ABC transporter ATP-binding protein [Actinomycetota bacterium]|nr:ABC transporter ATP-binding protein [Actinomycetota bacterium]
MTSTRQPTFRRDRSTAATDAGGPADEHIARFEDVEGHFVTRSGDLHALRGVSFPVRRGAITGLVGETGSGKSVVARLLLGMSDDNFRLTGGRVLVDGTDVLELGARARRSLRGRTVSMVFQDAKSALNPVFTIGEQLSRPLRERERVGRKDAWAAATDLLDRVRIPEPGRRARQYAHQFSGGMAQRAMIALGLVQKPDLVVLDEPTTGLDVTIQAEVLDLIRDLGTDEGLTALLITHDLGVVAETCDQVAVMYAGRCVEYGTARQIFEEPAHPYTRELLAACRSVELDEGELASIPGVVPDLREPPAGCAFADRCPDRMPVCGTEPPVVHLQPGWFAACHLHDPDGGE